MKRRDFLRLAVTGTGLALIPRSSRASDAHIEILLDEPIAPVTANLYGHFVEHLGGVVYDGIWVGESSKIANTGGIRRGSSTACVACPQARSGGQVDASPTATIGGMASVPARHVPAVRTSGRTTWRRFPMARRSTSPTSSARTISSASVGSRAVALSGRQSAQPARARLLSMGGVLQQPRRHLDPGRPEGQRRRSRSFQGALLGSRQRILGMRRQFHAGEYATEFRRFTAWLPRYGVRLAFIAVRTQQWRPLVDATVPRARSSRKVQACINAACGDWPSITIRGTPVAVATTDWNAGKGDAVEFTTDEWYELLNEADHMETLITDHWKVMGGDRLPASGQAGCR